MTEVQPPGKSASGRGQILAIATRCWPGWSARWAAHPAGAHRDAISPRCPVSSTSSWLAAAGPSTRLISRLDARSRPSG